MKACWADNTFLPGACVLDDEDGASLEDCYQTCYGGNGLTDKTKCDHWGEVFAVQLCKEILGDGYDIRPTHKS